MDALLFLAAPATLCLILVGIHCYLGLHVLARGVIFVDLALAQVASLGAVVALVATGEEHSSSAYWISLGCAVAAALFFALAHRVAKRVPPEALIGTVFAFASAAIVVLLDRAAHGADHLKSALVGQLLYVSWSDVLKTLAIYVPVALAHWWFRKPLLATSFESTPSSNRWKWDALFYGLFALVITSSVQFAGVLLVFSFLIVPAILATLLAKTLRARLLLGWGLGAVLCVIGLVLSYQADLPTGAGIVLVFTSAVIGVVSALALWPRNRKTR